jgi:predicted ABC-type transport system involved in lysophospholipase L1 biosynthesis ATPase subunit
LLRVIDVVKTYHEGGVESRVLRGASLEVARGTTTSLAGSSGSGKSTLLSIIAGLARPDSGDVVFAGHELSGLDDAGLAGLRAVHIGVVLQTGNLIPFLTAVENVELALDLGRSPRREARARDLLGEVGLSHRLDHLPRRLSGGETQRVAIAMALAKEPDLLLADEVTGELDSSTAAQVMTVIFGAARERGLCVLYVTHDADLAAGAQHRLRIVDGCVTPT